MTAKKKPEEEGLKSSARGGKKRKRKSKAASTTADRAKKQRTKDRYAHAREDAQLQGLLPTIPAEALKSEVVDPTSQGDGAPALTASLVATAIRRGWAVSPECAARYVDILDGILNDPDVPAKVKVAAFQALRMADQAQWERDNPDKAGKAKGGTVVNNTNNVQNNNTSTIVTGDVFGDIDRTIQAIEGRSLPALDAEAVRHVLPHGTQQQVPEEQPTHAEEESEADRLPDGDGL